MFVIRCLKQNAPSCKFEQTWLALLHKNKPTLSSSAWPLFSNTFLTLKERHCMIKNKCPIQNISRQIKFCHWLNTLDYATNKILNAMKYITNTQGFWYFARSRSREIPVNPRNLAKFTKTQKIPRNLVEILSNTCLYNIFETYFSDRGYFLATNLQIYLGTSLLKCANNVLKLPGKD